MMNLCVVSTTFFDPSNTTFVKHFIARTSKIYKMVDYIMNNFVAGYGNTTKCYRCSLGLNGSGQHRFRNNKIIWSNLMTFGLVKHNNNSISAITSAGSLAQGK